jgi:hypothetical protein
VLGPAVLDVVFCKGVSSQRVQQETRGRKRTVVLVLNAEEVVENAPRLVKAKLVDAGRECRVEVKTL